VARSGDEDVGAIRNPRSSVEISDGYANDYRYFKGLVARTGENGFNMKEVSADKAYLGGENLLVTLRQGAIPYIPFKSNSQIQTNYGPECFTSICPSQALEGASKAIAPSYRLR